MPLDAGPTTYQGKNFAPIEALKRAKSNSLNPKENPSSVDAFFREQWQGLSTENDDSWREVIEQARVISILRSGKLTIKPDLSGSGYVFLRPLSSNGGRDRSNYPVFPQNSEILSAKWQRARPTVRSRNYGDGYKAELQLDEIDTVIKSYFRDVFTSIYETREAYSAQDYGTYITQFQYDEMLNQMFEIVPIVQNESKVLVEGYGACYSCKFEGHPSDFEQTGAPYPQCPQCGSFETTEMLPDAVADETRIVDAETIVQGDIRGKLIDWAACRYDPRVFAHESGYFLYRERFPIRLVHKLFGEDLEVDTDTASDFGLQVIDSLAARGGNIEHHGANDLWDSFQKFTEEATLESMWLKPEQYTNFKLKESEATLAGRIPKDVPFEDLFPDGLCIRGFNDMRVIVGIHAEKPNLASGVYLYQSHSGHGKGVSDAVDIAKDLNEVYSMAWAGIKRFGASGLAVAADAGITQENVRNLFKPQKAVFVDIDRVGGNINNAIMQVQSTPVNPALPQMMIQLNNMMGMAFMSDDYTASINQDVDINTFAGQQLQHAKKEEQKGGILTRKTFHRELSAEILYELFRKHIKIPRWYTEGQDRHSKTRGKFVSGTDMPERVKFDAVPESEVPDNKFEKRVAGKEMLMDAGGLIGLIEASHLDPKMTSWFTGIYGHELPTLNEKEMRMVCIARVANIVELSQVFPDPEQILASLDKSLNVRESMHLLKSEFLQQILDDDEVQTWNPVAKATVERLIERHYEMEAEAQVRNETIKMNAMNQLAAQQMAAQQAMMAPQMEAEAAMMEEQALLGAAAEVGGRILDDEQKAVDAEREQEKADIDYERQEKSADKNHQRQLELEKAKAKMRPAPAKGQAAKRKA